jgi:hypothetical protein
MFLLSLEQVQTKMQCASPLFCGDIAKTECLSLIGQYSPNPILCVIVRVLAQIIRRKWPADEELFDYFLF